MSDDQKKLSALDIKKNDSSQADLSAADLTTLEKLYSETAKISWLELQRFFAQGVVMNVAPELDLLKVAVMFAEDDAAQLALLLEDKQVVAPTNQQALHWFEHETSLWSVVVAPFVLVQDKPILDQDKVVI